MNAPLIFWQIANSSQLEFAVLRKQDCGLTCPYPELFIGKKSVVQANLSMYGPMSCNRYKFVSFQICSAYLLYDFVSAVAPVVLRTTAALENRHKLR